MQLFTRLFWELDATNRTTEKVAALERYFAAAPPEDAAWALYFLMGKRIKRAVNSKLLWEMIENATGYPPWLLEESYGAVGDLAETFALLLPGSDQPSPIRLHKIVEERIASLPTADDESRRRIICGTWEELDTRQLLVWHKLITGSFRAGVARTLVVRAIASVAQVEPAVMAHRLSGQWEPNAENYLRLLSGEEHESDDPGRPYPFYLAYPLEAAPESLGDPGEWQIEWKWDGIRGQLIRRRGHMMLWSRGEDMITDRFPEIRDAALALPEGTVLDGEVLIWRGESAEPFAQLQRRIGRKSVGHKMLAELPATFMAYDYLEQNGADIREWPLCDRRAALENLIGTVSRGLPIRLSPVVHAASWQEVEALREESRGRGVEGFMLKRLASPYGVGRVKGDWWKWKIAPHTCDCVMIYAQRGHGRRASLYTDYTFAVWKDKELVPVMKAYSGLTDEEIRRLDNWIRRNTLDRFGPVRVVKPDLVFELAFEGIQRSSRHKSGIAVRFPRIARWRNDKKPEEADTIESLERLLAGTRS